MIKNEVLRALQKIGGIFSALNVEVVVGGDSAYTDGKAHHSDSKRMWIFLR